jgi:hypothetical protein
MLEKDHYPKRAEVDHAMENQVKSPCSSFKTWSVVLFFADEKSPSTHQHIKKSPGYFLGSVSNTEAFHDSTLLLVKPQSNQSNKKCSVLEDVSS